MTSAYGRSGVRTTEELAGFPRMLDVLRETMSFRGDRAGAPAMDFGYYANVLDLGNNTGLAISTDGVGTKIVVAELMRKFDTIGIDCIAMNVNDIICVGAEPIAMTDYVAVEHADASFLAELAIGLREGARQSHISIPGGEIAQIRDLVRGFDVVGTCVGLVQMDKIIRGDRVAPGDAVVGFASSGIHSNGLTLARRVLIGEHVERVFDHVAELGRALGEELLEPTRIYVDLALSLMAAVDVRAMTHITSDGFLNLARIDAEIGFQIEALPETPPIFGLIQRAGDLSDAEMFLVYNMGVGFCAIVPESDVARTLEIARDCGIAAMRIGTVTDDATKRVDVLPAGLTSAAGHFEATRA